MERVIQKDKNTFQVIFMDGRFRPYRATYTRTRKGAFPKLALLERKQDNGRVGFWTVYRPACHGEPDTILKMEMANAATIVRTA